MEKENGKGGKKESSNEDDTRGGGGIGVREKEKRVKETRERGRKHRPGVSYPVLGGPQFCRV